MSQIPSEKEIIQDIVKDQLHRYSDYAIQDLYKLFYQATMGNKHLLKNEAKARENLETEWSDLGKVRPYESLLEVIDPADVLMRVNLRVYRKTGGTIQNLFEIMKTTADQFQENSDLLDHYWKVTAQLAEDGQIPFSKSDLMRFWYEMKEQNFPELSHSDKYQEVHEPAYRVVMKSLWEGFKKD